MEKNELISVLSRGSRISVALVLSSLNQTHTQDFQKSQATNAIKGFDVLHQLFRLRHAKSMPDGEIELIMQTLAGNVQNYDQVVEVSSHCKPQETDL